MKKVISAVMALVIIFAFSGCSLFGEKTDISGKYTLNSVVSLVINEEYEKLLLEKGDETVENSDTEIVIEGSMIFDTSGKSKDEIGNMVFIQGVEITDNDGNKAVVNL